MEAEVTRADRIRGAVYGLLIGDALGVPYEFRSASDIPPLGEIEFVPPDYFRPSHTGVPPGTWSDDGSQALILLNSLLEKGELDLSHFAQGLVDWYDKGYMTPDGVVFDVGVQTAKSIRELKSGIDPTHSGGFDELSNGNGSLMRVLPLGLWHQGSDQELIRDSFRQSAVTHAHLRSGICCAIYCLWARYILQGSVDPWEQAYLAFRASFAIDSVELMELDQRVLPVDGIWEIRGSGYVVHTLRAAKWASDKGTFESCVRSAVALGEDTDTTACVAGGIAGLLHGINGIPERWVEGLNGKQIVEPLVQQLIDRAAATPPFQRH